MSARAPVAPSVLRWARETAGLSVEDAASRLNVRRERLEEWESGDAHPTINQLRNVADKYRRPFGVFLMKEPPREQPLPHDFRHLPGEPPPPTTALLLGQIRAAGERRRQALELYDDIGEEPPTFSVRANLQENVEAVGARLRAALTVTDDQQARWRSAETALTAWKDLFEQAGVLVFQFSRLDLGEMRGLSLAEAPLPVVVTNSKDAAAGRVFTLFHELTHIALRTSGICDLDEDERRAPEEREVEVFCNACAGAALVPAERLLSQETVRARGQSGLIDWTDAELDAIKRTFAVSRFVVLRRLAALGRASDAYYRARHNTWMAELERVRLAAARQEVIIPPFRKALSSTGKQFARLVFRAYYDDRITLNDVSEYLNLKVRHLPKVEREIFR